MTGLTWLRRRGPCHLETRSMADWQILQVRGKFVSGEPEKKFLEMVDGLLQSGARKVVIDLTESLLADDSVATAAAEAYHKAREKGVEMRFVVQPGKAGGYYHMAGLEMTIPTFSRLTGAIEI
jgi:anti-anti-sigma regulatory factor